MQEKKRDQLLEACSGSGLGTTDLLENLVGQQKPVVGVIGDQSSDITIQVIERKASAVYCMGVKRETVKLKGDSPT